jgi:hypothetical protein
MDDISKIYMRRDELRRFLGKDGKPISDRTLRHWEQKRNAPPRVKVGQVCLYRVADVEAWLDQNIENGSAQKRRPARSSAAGTRPAKMQSARVLRASTRVDSEQSVT